MFKGSTISLIVGKDEIGFDLREDDPEKAVKTNLISIPEVVRLKLKSERHLLGFLSNFENKPDDHENDSS